MPQRSAWRATLAGFGSAVPDRRRVWRRIASGSRRLETIAKPITYILASLGLLSIYFPGLKRFWEEMAMPSAWYQVGTLRLSVGQDKNHRQSILMRGGTYDAAAWNGGVRLPDLLAIEGQDLRTDATAVGRKEETLRSSVKTVLGPNQCLHVRDISFARFRPALKRGDMRAGAQEAGIRLSTASVGHSDADAYFRAMIGNPGSCQPLTETERNDAAKADKSWNYPYRMDAPVCPRINVWVKAAKVSC